MFGSKKYLLLLVFLLCTIHIVSAQSESKYYTNSDTKWLVEVPLWIPGFRGQLSYGDISLDSETPKDPIELERLEKDPGLEFYFVGRAAYRNGKFWVQADAFSGRVGNTFTFVPTRGSVKKELAYVSAQGTLPRVSIGYSVWRKKFNKKSDIEILAYTGLRYIYIEFTTEIPSTGQNIDIVSKWLEPLIGVSVPVTYKRFKLELQADWGGNSNNNSVMVNSHFKYRISKLVETKLGWTSIYSHHNALVEDQLLNFNINLQGPAVGVGFIF